MPIAVLPSLRIAGATLLCLAACLMLPLASANAAPRAPAPSSPAPGAQVESAPVFKWSHVRGAERYEFQLSADRRFASRLLGRRNGSRVTANRYATVDKALANGTYYWRVRAIDGRDRAGRWSATRTLNLQWETPPTLIGPVDGATVTWPAEPLVLDWSPVPGATDYEVTVATDPSLANVVVGTARQRVRTQGTVLAVPHALQQGTYYWAVTPLNAQGHKGQRSRVARFNWRWPSSTRVRWNDLHDDARVFDPQFSWDPVAGAARYEVEINSSQDYAPGSKVCCTDPTIGTALAPTRVLPNNSYYWRVRAVDADGNAGVWNDGTRIRKDFNPVGPGNPETIPNLRLRTNESSRVDTGSAVEVPVVDWDPVPGASSYEVQVVPRGATGCNWTPPRGTGLRVVTAATAWTPLGRGQGNPSGIAYPTLSTDTVQLERGQDYCVRVAARSDRDSQNGEVVSDWTQLGGFGANGFHFAAANVGTPANPFSTPASSYLAPRAQQGTLSELPLFTWKAVSGAQSYFVVVAKDPAFTEVIDLALTRVPAYAPRAGNLEATTYPDASGDDSNAATTYHWVVFPASSPGGSGVSTYYFENSPQSFQKRSNPPVRIAPTEDSSIFSQPTFRWLPADGARKYRLQVAQDANFRELLDDVTTASTAFTSSTTYPADTQLHWRVRATDEKGLGLPWSSTGTFRRRLAVPTLDPQNPLEGGTLPLLTWSPVEGAVSYDVHVDQADGRQKEFTFHSPAFAPTLMYGNGIWRWSVRANYPTLTRGRPAKSGYSESLPFTRRVDPPSGARGLVQRKAILLTWRPVDGGQQYRVELSRTNSFQRLVEVIETDSTSWAPLMLRPQYRESGIFHWRVASVDDGNNVGGWTEGTIALGKGLQIRAAGAVRAGTRSRLRITVLDHRRRAVAGATVAVRGLGTRDQARTDRRGRATLRIKPTRRGSITVTAAKRGFAGAEHIVQVR